EELLPLGSALRAPDALVGVTPCQLAPLDLLLLEPLCFLTCSRHRIEHDARRGDRIEALVEVDRPHGLHQSCPPLNGARVEQTPRPIEPAAGAPRHRRTR